MKIQCDVCDKEEASVFCSADEAALCDGCDRRVHHANKLSGKHLRFSLLHPSFKEAPRCDICHERRAFMFCKEDRTILCRECNIPIHRANEHTQKHNRFLLTGVKLSASSSLFPTSSSSSTGFDAAIGSAISTEIFSSQSAERQLPSNYRVEENQISDTGSVSTSSISEYLETLPGWRVEDFLDPSTASNCFCKADECFLEISDRDLESKMGFFSSENLVNWIPEVSSKSKSSAELPLDLNGFKKEREASKVKVGWKGIDGDCLIVPQVSPPSHKRSRQLW